MIRRLVFPIDIDIFCFLCGTFSQLHLVLESPQFEMGDVCQCLV